MRDQTFICLLRVNPGLTLLEGMASDLVVLSSKKSGLNLTSENKALYFDPLDVSSIKVF